VSSATSIFFLFRFFSKHDWLTPFFGCDFFSQHKENTKSSSKHEQKFKEFEKKIQTNIKNQTVIHKRTRRSTH